MWHGEHVARPATTPWSSPAGSPTATTCARGPWPASRPVMEAVASYAADGGPVVGICNGFQVLTEAGLLPGALQKNRGLRFLCTTVGVEVCTTRTVLTSETWPRAPCCALPINHFEGNYTCDAATLERLRAEDRIVLRYTANPNGSLDDIAGMCNEAGNVVGPHAPPRAGLRRLTGSTDGMGLLESLGGGRPPPAPSRVPRLILTPARRLACSAPHRRRVRRDAGALEDGGARPRRPARRCSRCPCARP